MFEAVAAPTAALAVDPDLPDRLADDPEARPVLDAVARDDTPTNRRRVAEELLTTPGDLRRELLDHLDFVGLDPYWVDRMAADLPPPYPDTGLAAWLLPAE